MNVRGLLRYIAETRGLHPCQARADERPPQRPEGASFALDFNEDPLRNALLLLDKADEAASNDLALVYAIKATRLAVGQLMALQEQEQKP